jgi:2-oxoisovalerate dehydrogenase E2 component (dihydrolipoyl transacylase)
MEDYLIPDRARIAATLRRLARVDRAQRPSVSMNGRGAAPALLSRSPAEESDTPKGSLAAARAREGVPQASSVIEVDLSRVAKRLDDSRSAWQERGLVPSYTPFFAEALLAALRAVPQANAAFDAEAAAIRRHRAVHLGLSVASSDGSAARHAVITDADTRNVLGLAMEVDTVRASGGLADDALAEATIGLADYGPESALFAVPVVHPGQVASVRFGAVEERLVTRERGFALAPTAYVTASIDHRALDGMDAGALLNALKRYLENEDVG